MQNFSKDKGVDTHLPMCRSSWAPAGLERLNARHMHCLVSFLIFLPASGFNVYSPGSLQRSRSPSFLSSDVVDVDFVPVERDEDASSRKESQTIFPDEKSQNLFDLSLESDPDFLNTRIPFVDCCGPSANGVNCIDVKLAFMAELDKVQYGIAIPFDSAVALTFEKEDGTVQYLAPDLDENEELMEIMACQLKEHVGEDLRLMRTPRVLTVSGPLDEYTKDWKTKLIPKPIEPKALLSRSDDADELADFHKFMREELGEEEYLKTLNETPNEDEMNSLLHLFEVPGLGDKRDDNKGIEDMLRNLLSPELDFEEAKNELGLANLEHEGVALKLISYVFASGKSYSLVKLLNPYAIVAKYVTAGGDQNGRFELLTPAEEEIVLPRLEQACKKDLELAGLKL
jgi:hypothetical protein